LQLSHEEQNRGPDGRLNKQLDVAKAEVIRRKSELVVEGGIRGPQDGVEQQPQHGEERANVRHSFGHLHTRAAFAPCLEAIIESPLVHQLALTRVD
jgi:hypothetical protein